MTPNRDSVPAVPTPYPPRTRYRVKRRDAVPGYGVTPVGGTPGYRVAIAHPQQPHNRPPRTHHAPASSGCFLLPEPTLGLLACLWPRSGARCARLRRNRREPGGVR